MLSPTHESYLNLRKLSAGDALRAVSQIGVLVGETGVAALVTSVGDTRRICQQLVDLEQLFATAKTTREGKYPAKALEIDDNIDRQSVSLHNIISALRSSAAPDSPEHIAATELMQRLFPEGIGAIVNAKVTEQAAAVQRIISLLRGELAPQAEICGVPAVVVNRIAQLSDLLAKELENIKDEGVSYQDVRAAQLDAHRATLQLIVQIFAAYPSYGEEDLARRTELLAPLAIASQNAKQERRARRQSAAQDTSAP